MLHSYLYLDIEGERLALKTFVKILVKVGLVI